MLSEFSYKCSGPLGFFTTKDRENAGFPRSSQDASKVIVRDKTLPLGISKVMGWDVLHVDRTLNSSIFSMAIQKASIMVPLSPSGDWNKESLQLL